MASSIVDRVRLLQASSGESLRGLSELAGASHSVLAGLLKLRWKELSVRVSSGLARTCGVSLDWLLTGEGPEPDPAAVRAAVERARAVHKNAAPSPVAA